MRNYTRPWIDSGLEHGHEDPLLIYKVGESQIKVHAVESILGRAGEFIDIAIAYFASPTSQSKKVAENVDRQFRVFGRGELPFNLFVKETPPTVAQVNS